MKKNKALKFDTGKPPMDLISYYSMEELAKVLDFGAKEYGSYNWTKGLKYSRVIAAAERHLGKWKNRENSDGDSGLHHLAHCMANIMFLLDYEIRNLKHLDDRRPLHSIKKRIK